MLEPSVVSSVSPAIVALLVAVSEERPKIEDLVDVLGVADVF